MKRSVWPFHICPVSSLWHTIEWATRQCKLYVGERYLHISPLEFSSRSLLAVDVRELTGGISTDIRGYQTGLPELMCSLCSKSVLL